MKIQLKTLASSLGLLVTLGLTTGSAPKPVHAGGSALTGAALRVSPACIVLGHPAMVRVTMTGLRSGENVAFSGPPRPVGSSGNIGVFRAGRSGIISFTFPYTPVSISEVAQHGIFAYRLHGNPAHPHAGPGLWLANSASLRVVLQAAQCR